MDLLTVVMHELGHELGLADLSVSTAAHALMAESITTGIRRLPPAMTPAMVTPMKAAAPHPLMAAAMAPLASCRPIASDTVFASLDAASNSIIQHPCRRHPSRDDADVGPLFPLRVETNLPALQPTPIMAANSTLTSGAVPRKTAIAVDSVFNLLGRWSLRPASRHFENVHQGACQSASVSSGYIGRGMCVHENAVRSD